MQTDLGERAVLLVDLASLERVERVEAVDDLSKDRVWRREGSGCVGRREERGREGGGRGFGARRGAQLLSRCGCLA